MKHRCKFLVTGALLLAATSAVAGIIFVPVGGRFINPELALVSVNADGAGAVLVRSTGLTGEFSLDARDVPAAFDPPATGCKRLPFDQRLELIINLSLGVVEGRARGRISTGDGGTLDYRAEVRGSATCLPYGGRACGQLITDLELRGAFVDISDPMMPGLIRIETLGSLLRGPDGARWSSLVSNARLGGDAPLIGSLATMEAGESCGV